jgi:hypothetical protein
MAVIMDNECIVHSLGSRTMKEDYCPSSDKIMILQNAVLIAAAWQEREALVSRHVRRVCSSSIVTPNARRIIGPSTNKTANNVLPSYEMRRCSRIHRPRRIVQFASYQCHTN